MPLSADIVAANTVEGEGLAQRINVFTDRLVVGLCFIRLEGVGD